MSFAAFATPTDPRIVRRGLAILRMAVRTQPKPFAVAVVGAAVYGLTTVASAVVFGLVTDRVIQPAYERGETTAAALAAGAAAIVGVALVKAVGIIVRRVGASYMQYRLQAIFRRRVTRQYTRLSLSWHRRHSTGELLSNANADVESTFWPIAPLPLSIGVMVMLVAAGVVLVVTDPVLGAVGLLLAPAIALVNGRYNTRIHGPATRSQQIRADVSEVAHESFDGALVVKTLGREQAETQRFAVQSERLRDELIAYGRVRSVFEPLMEALPNIGVLLLVLAGAYRLDAGAVSVGEVVRVGYLFTLLAFPLRAIGFLLTSLPRSVVGWERVERVLDARADLLHGDVAVEPVEGGAGVDVVDVSFRYEPDGDDAAGGQPSADGAARALRAVTLSAAPGRTIALVGPTGAGKSTLASLLVRLADPQEGMIALDGHDLRSLAPGALARHAAIVFQHTFLFDDTVRENVTLGLDATGAEVEAACRLAQAHGFITRLPHGYDTVVGERGTSLSGGQRQRVALARALVRRPRLLILDDATSSVDPSVEQAILRGLREADLPSTVILVAYRRASIELADEVVFVEAGAVRGRGTHEDLMASVPGYRGLITAYNREAESQVEAGASAGPWPGR